MSTINDDGGVSRADRPSLFTFQTIQAKTPSTANEGLPYSLMLTRFMLDASVVVGHHELTTMQLSPINSAIVRRSFSHGLGSQHSATSLQPEVRAQAVEELVESSTGTART